jgi:hypothetical protein
MAANQPVDGGDIEKAGKGMILAAAPITPGTAITFPSPRSGREVSGQVREDRGTYAAVIWDEDGAKLATCMYKGFITMPGQVQETPTMSDIPATGGMQLALFENFEHFENFDNADLAPPAPVSVSVSTPMPMPIASSTVPVLPEQPKLDPESIAMRWAHILSPAGAHICYLRDVTVQAVASWRREGYAVIDLSELVSGACATAKAGKEQG